ncbi:hypothetical protein KFL_005910020 [Klebsormidium nitens]|uniref:Uncharacterized protein n=1 Tax=Klebsormidium nitens TaxID=105231 RepID=A0A1Y1IGP3_KLENI|nr:hypothetical protein KFL_005910020 [Klebsormidium nitens]|eukprot:GAQ90025.1 hypothetical protein KFL_005910020 [Klebsormidium nitens]
MIWAIDEHHTRMFGDDKWLCVLLLFGGIGAELEGLLKAGVKIRKVLYVDNDPISRRVFGHRLRALHHAYPEQLPELTYPPPPHGATLEHQGHRQTGAGAPHRARGTAPNRPGAIQPVRTRVWVRLDAQDALDNFRTVQMAAQDDPAIRGYYCVNVKGEPLQTFPTLVATPSSYAFRFQAPDQPGPGLVYDRSVREWQEPNADERERIMGMLPWSTRGYNIPEAERA